MLSSATAVPSSLEVVAVHILVLVKPVPVVGTERLDERHQTRRDVLELNGNDEYMLERALRLTESQGCEVSLLAMAPPGGVDALRKGLAIGATRAYHVVDAAIAGSDVRATVRVLSAAIGRIGADLVFVGAGSSDGSGSVVSAALAARLRLPYLGDASDISLGGIAGSPVVRARRPMGNGHEVVQVGLPAVVMGTQLLGEPRYPSLRGIMAARSREIITWDLADLGIEPASVGWAASGTRVMDVATPPERGTATIVTTPPDRAAAAVVDFLASRGLI
jgi:electron transfer flavoprotein beta subunit